MNTIEQAREVSGQLHLGISISNDRNIGKEFTPIAKVAATTIDALIAELEEIKSQFEMGLEREVYWNGQYVLLSEELASIKGQEPVGHLTLDGDFIQNQRWVMEFGIVPRGRPLYLAAGAQPLTPAMITAGQHAWMTADGVDPARVYHAMLAAAK